MLIAQFIPEILSFVPSLIDYFGPEGSKEGGGAGGILGALAQLLATGFAAHQGYQGYQQSKEDSERARQLTNQGLDLSLGAANEAREEYNLNSPLRDAYRNIAMTFSDPTNPFSQLYPASGTGQGSQPLEPITAPGLAEPDHSQRPFDFDIDPNWTWDEENKGWWTNSEEGDNNPRRFIPAEERLGPGFSRGTGNAWGGFWPPGQVPQLDFYQRQLDDAMGTWRDFDWSTVDLPGIKKHIEDTGYDPANAPGAGSQNPLDPNYQPGSGTKVPNADPGSHVPGTNNNNQQATDGSGQRRTARPKNEPTVPPSPPKPQSGGNDIRNDLRGWAERWKAELEKRRSNPWNVNIPTGY